MRNLSAHSFKKHLLRLAVFTCVITPAVAPARTIVNHEPIAAFFTTTGALTCKPNGLWFGKVELGTAKSLSGTLINTGNTIITISSINQSSRFFSVSGITLPLSIPPGMRIPFTVIFAPENTGRTDDSLGFVSDASAAVLYLTIHGVGYVPGTLSTSPSTIAFGTVALGQTATQNLVLTNSGRSSVTVSQVGVSGGFSAGGVAVPFSLGIGQSVQLALSFKAQSSGTANGSLTITSNAAAPSLVVPMSATVASAGTLQAVSSSLSFGSVNVGGTSSKMETITNSGGTNVTILQASVSGTSFSFSGLPIPVTLSPGQSYTFPISFNLANGGSLNGNLAIASDASNPSLNIALSGSGLSAGQLGFTPSSLDFGNVTVGQTKSMGASLSASGANVTVSSASMTSNEFKLGGLTLPTTILAGQSVTLNLMFTPGSSGAAAANLSLQSNATNPVAEALIGYGVAVVQHSVSLSWAQSGTNISGFNVYRATVSGGPYTRINSNLVAGTNYNDSTVASGTTYFYVTSAVSSTGAESKYSNQAQASVPNP